MQVVNKIIYLLCKGMLHASGRRHPSRAASILPLLILIDLAARPSGEKFFQILDGDPVGSAAIGLGVLVDALRLSTLHGYTWFADDLWPGVGWISVAHPPEDMMRVVKRRVDKRSASTGRYDARRQA